MQEKDMKFDIDALLRDTAKADNEALPFSEWKDSLLRQAAEAPPAGENTLAFEAPVKKRTLPSRQWVIGLSTVAAAFLVVVGMRALYAPVPAAAPAAAPAAPAADIYTVEESAQGEAPAAAAGMLPPEDMRMAEAAPMAPEAYSGGVGADSATADAGGAGADAPMMSASMMAPTWNEQEQAAIRALQQALGLPEEEAPYAMVFQTQGEAYTLAGLGDEKEPFPLTDTAIYEVTLDTTAEAPDTYALDAQTLEVLGRIVARENPGF